MMYLQWSKKFVLSHKEMGRVNWVNRGAKCLMRTQPNCRRAEAYIGISNTYTN